MSATKIEKEIIKNCKGDQVMQDFLLDLLDLNLTEGQWYNDEYMKRLSHYAEKMEDNDED